MNRKDQNEKINHLRESIGLFPFTESSSSLLCDTWYSQYPFKAIKKAMFNCATCFTQLEYILLESRIASESKRKFQAKKNDDGFILVDHSVPNKVHMIGFKKYERKQTHIDY